MTNLYINNCDISASTGDGVVGKHELSAIKALGDVKVLDAGVLRKYNPTNDPFLQDYFCNELVRNLETAALACLYGGPYNATVHNLKLRGTKTIVTMPAHNRALSIGEHERWFGAGTYPYMHVKDDGLWEIYIEHVRLCDRVIAPSTHAKENIMRDMRVSESKVIVITHGCDIPADVKPLPEKFTVGYMSQVGPDKGLIYLIQAWSELGYKDSELILAGSGTDSPFMESMIKQLAPNGKFRLLGRVEDPSDVYNACSIMVQPSVTEGGGVTILEALAHGRPVITTKNCVGGDVIANGANGYIVPIRDSHEIAFWIKALRKDIELVGSNPSTLLHMSQNARASSLKYSWDNIERRYAELYREVLEN